MAAALASGPPAKARWLTLTRRRQFYALLFVLPALINFAIFRYVPILSALRISLYNYSMLGGFKEFTGLDQYFAVLQDPLFFHSVWVAIEFSIVKVPVQIFLSILLAIFVSRDVRGMNLMRTIIFIPVVTSLVVTSILWQLMYNKDLGLIQSLLGVFGIPHTAFLGSATLALPSLIVMMIWKDIGFSTIIFVAGLKGIPDTFYEASAIDGASKVRQFINITLPLLKPVTLFVVVTQTIASLQVFVPIFVMTQGGPEQSTNAIVYYIYQYAFDFNEMGVACAMSFIVLILMCGVSYTNYKFLQSDVEY